MAGLRSSQGFCISQQGSQCRYTALAAKCCSPMKGQDLLEGGITHLQGKKGKGKGEKTLNTESEM